MIESKDIKNMVQHILRREKGIADTHIMHPAREWFIGLSIAFVMVALGSWFCFYLYMFHSNEMKKEVEIIEQAVPYQATVVKSALEVFAEKKQKYNAIIGGEETTNLVTDVATTTPSSAEETATTTEDIPELIVDPAPTFTDEEVQNAVLAP
jgi:hypothetical protein